MLALLWSDGAHNCDPLDTAPALLGYGDSPVAVADSVEEGLEAPRRSSGFSSDPEHTEAGVSEPHGLRPYAAVLDAGFVQDLEFGRILPDLNPDPANQLVTFRPGSSQLPPFEKQLAAMQLGDDEDKSATDSLEDGFPPHAGPALSPTHISKPEPQLQQQQQQQQPPLPEPARLQASPRASQPRVLRHAARPAVRPHAPAARPMPNARGLSGRGRKVRDVEMQLKMKKAEEDLEPYLKVHNADELRGRGRPEHYNFEKDVSGKTKCPFCEQRLARSANVKRHVAQVHVQL
jgi:hypothetical protein